MSRSRPNGVSACVLGASLAGAIFATGAASWAKEQLTQEQKLERVKGTTAKILEEFKKENFLSSVTDKEDLWKLVKRAQSEEGWCDGSDAKSRECGTEEKEFLTRVLAIEKFREALTKDIAARRKVSTSFQFGYTRDDVPDEGAASDDVNKINSTISVKSESYPLQFRADWSVDVRYADSELTEEFSAAHLNFDYYFKNWIEGFGFVDRLSDSFMSIEQRYEVGFGGDFEAYQSGRRSGLLAKCQAGNTGAILRGLTRNGKEALEGFVEMCAAGLVTKGDETPTRSRGFRNLAAVGDEAIVRAVGKKYEERGIALRDAAQVLLDVAQERGYFDYVAQRYSVVEVSVGVAVLHDSTAYDLEATDTGTGETVHVTSATSVNRWSLRPGFRARPIDELEIRLLYLWKPAFGERSSTFDDDYRVDAHLSISFTGKPIVSDAKPKVQFLVDYYRHHDPPTTTELLGVPAPTLVPTEAAGRHIKSRLIVGLEF